MGSYFLLSSAPLLDPGVSYVTAISGLSNQTTYTLSGIAFGDVVKGRNQRAVLALISYGHSSSFSVSITSASIGGYPASVILSLGVTGATSIVLRYYWIAAVVPAGTTGDIVFTDNTSLVPSVSVLRAINLDVSSVHDSDIDAGTSSASLAVDCPAGGAIIGFGSWGYGGSSGPATSATFNNLTGIGGGGNQLSAAVFPTVQTALNTSFSVSPSSGLARVEGHVFSLPALYP